MPVYRISGLVVNAEMDLPGVIPMTAGVSDPQVHIRGGRHIPEQLDAVTDRGPVWELNRNHFLLKLPEIGRVLAVAGATLDVDPAPGVNMEDVVPFLLGTGWGAILNQRGFMTLHASVVAINGSAIALCGASGAGKSTIAAALCAAGAQFVCDDITAIGINSAGMPVAWPDGRSLKLFDNSIEHLELNDNRTGEVRTGIRKHYVDPPGDRTGEPVRLDAIFILRSPAPSPGFRIEQLPALEAAQSLLANSYRRRLSLAMARHSATQIRTTGVVLQHVPVLRVYRRFGLEHLDEIVSGLFSRWRELAY